MDSDAELPGEWDEAKLSQVLSNLLGNAVQHGARSAIPPLGGIPQAVAGGKAKATGKVGPGAGISGNKDGSDRSGDQ